mgnify:CR=1 FL=1
MLVFDPLDGSSNIDVNINVGTIFSILRRKPGRTGEVQLDEILQPGSEQVAAGYFLYGTSTMLVYTTGQGVHGFTLDPSVGEFLLSHPDIRIPETGSIYSVNEGNWNHWDDKARAAIDYFKHPDDPNATPCSARYVGSLVADFHRTLLYGGVLHVSAGQPQGKEPWEAAVPVRSLVRWLLWRKNAGGAATDGHNRILDDHAVLGLGGLGGGHADAVVVVDLLNGDGGALLGDVVVPGLGAALGHMYHSLLPQLVGRPRHAAAVVAVGGGEEGGLAELLAEGLAGQVVVGHLGHVPAHFLGDVLGHGEGAAQHLEGVSGQSGRTRF